MTKVNNDYKKDKSIENWQLQGYPESKPKKRAEKEGIEELHRIYRGMLELMRIGRGK
ncbi:hypothetical protein ES708_06691 [subsurface metagenome]